MDKTIELVNSVKDIHAMPSVIVKALNIMKKPTANMKELGEIVMFDQSLTIKFLALVNSAYYGFSQQISSINIALSLLGMVKVKNIIVAVAMKPMMSNQGDKELWKHSMRVASGCEYIANLTKIMDADEAFIAGFVHDVGKIGISNNIINKNGKLSSEEYAEIKKHPVIGRQILSSISKSPYLSIAANSHHERYDGHGYPEGLKGDDIPEIARIIAVADSYDAMTSKRSYRDPIPQDKVREEIVKGMGTQFDPLFATLMLHMIDLDTEYELKEHEEVKELSGKNTLNCSEFRAAKSEGILLTDCITRIKVHSRADTDFIADYTIPSFIVFDSLDSRAHETETKRKAMLYNEYAIIRFDGKVDKGNARKIESEIILQDAYKQNPPTEDDLIEEYKNGLDYEIEAVKVREHLLIVISNKFQTVRTTIALEDNTHFAYISLTGELCLITNVEIKKSDTPVAPDYIPRIAEEISYINVPQGDIPNLQVDEVNVLFDMEVKQSEKTESTLDLSAAAQAKLDLGLDQYEDAFFHAKYIISASVQHP